MKNPATVHLAYSRHWYQKLATNLTPTWMGVTVVKHPIDLFVYQQIVFETQPDLIIETGTYAGGSALYLANVCELVDHGRVLSVDLKTDRPLPDHPRVEYLLGMSSTDPVVVSHVAKRAAKKRCMVILDSAHNKRHVLDELNAYHGFVAKGCYLIVEDSNVDGYFLGAGDINGEGPAEAIREWQPTNKGFDVDRGREQMGFSQNPGGFLRRVR